jgi:hypothetical protein
LSVGGWVRSGAACRDTKLLSFGNEAEVEESEFRAAVSSDKGKSKSSHDILTDDPRLVAAPAVPPTFESSDEKRAADPSAIKRKLDVREALKKKPASASASASASSSSSAGSKSASAGGSGGGGGGGDDSAGADDFVGSEAEFDALMKAKLLAKRSGGAAPSASHASAPAPSAAAQVPGAEAAADGIDRQLKAEYAKLKRQVLSLKKTPVNLAPNPEGTLLLTAGSGSDNDEPASASSSSSSSSSSSAAAEKKNESLHSLSSAKAKSTSKRYDPFGLC